MFTDRCQYAMSNLRDSPTNLRDSPTNPCAPCPDDMQPPYTCQYRKRVPRRACSSQLDTCGVRQCQLGVLCVTNDTQRQANRATQLRHDIRGLCQESPALRHNRHAVAHMHTVRQSRLYAPKDCRAFTFKCGEEATQLMHRCVDCKGGNMAAELAQNCML